LPKRSEGKLGHAVMTIAVLTAAALIILAVAFLIGTVVQRRLSSQPTEHHEAPYAVPRHSEP
jgi:hypothetical protein